MRITVIGLGYVGLPVAASLATAGFDVLGFDIDPKHIRKLEDLSHPVLIEEPGLFDRFASAINGGELSLASNLEGTEQADAVLICVQTPFDSNTQAPDYGPLEAAINSTGQHLRKGGLLVVESTIAPGTMKNIVTPALEFSTGASSDDYLLGHCPERVMPGRMLENLRNVRRIMGGRDSVSTEAMIEIYSKIVEAPLVTTTLEGAEAMKVIENTHRDMEIAIANQLAVVCDSLEISFEWVRDELNALKGRFVLWPGAGVGGHCIPKDPLLLMHGLPPETDANLILAARAFNDSMPQQIAAQALTILTDSGANPTRRATVLGIAYLEDCGDTRASPGLEIVNLLENAGIDVNWYDPHVSSEVRPGGAKSLEVACAGSDLLIIATKHAEFTAMLLERIRPQMRTANLLDARFAITRKAANEAGFAYFGLGRKESSAAQISSS